MINCPAVAVVRGENVSDQPPLMVPESLPASSTT
jgi:hypothetical protein